MSVQRVLDNGSVRGSLDLNDNVIVGEAGIGMIVTVESYLAAQYDSSELPKERLAQVLQQAKGLSIDVGITNFVNNQTKLWEKSHPAAVASSGESKPGQCPQGTTFVTASGLVPDNFCVDDEATPKVGGEYPTWYEARDFCNAAGKFLLTYEQQQLAAESTNDSVVRSSGDWEWVLKSNGDESSGQVGGFFFYVVYSRSLLVEYLGSGLPGQSFSRVAFRCGGFPSPQS